jgi:transposase-like protein
MKCPLETQMDTSALTATVSSVRPGGVRCMRTNAEKVAIVEEAQQPGRSVAEVARKYGVNANLIFGWTRLHKRVNARPSVETSRPRRIDGAVVVRGA